MKFQIAPSEIEPATFRLVAQCHRVSQHKMYFFENNDRLAFGWHLVPSINILYKLICLKIFSIIYN